MLKRNLVPMAWLLLSFNFSTTMAAEQHAGDVQPWKVNGQVYTNGNLFEGDFGDLAGGLYSTDDPGFDADTEKGAFGAGNWLQFQGLSSLKFWNGTSWSNTVANGEYISIDDAIGNTSIFSASGVTNPFGVIGQFNNAGDIHEHLDFTIYNASNVKGGSVGAYLIEMVLTETAPNSTASVATASAPFSFVFNRGLDANSFETAVAAVSAVPVPGAIWLLGSALVGLLSFSRRSSYQLPA